MLFKARCYLIWLDYNRKTNKRKVARIRKENGRPLESAVLYWSNAKYFSWSGYMTPPNKVSVHGLARTLKEVPKMVTLYERGRYGVFRYQPKQRHWIRNGYGGIADRTKYPVY
jgi:hypothetical protein